MTSLRSVVLWALLVFSITFLCALPVLIAGIDLSNVTFETPIPVVVGIGILLTDHREMETLTITDRNYIICDGRVLIAGDKKTVLNNEEAQRAYFGKRSYHDPGILGGGSLVA